jgi:hypothetical protein
MGEIVQIPEVLGAKLSEANRRVSVPTLGGGLTSAWKHALGFPNITGLEMGARNEAGRDPLRVLSR